MKIKQHIPNTLTILNLFSGLVSITLTFQGNYNASPRWSSRGEKIVFMCRLAGNQICLINPDGSGLQQLTSAGFKEHLIASGDGKNCILKP